MGVLFLFAFESIVQRRHHGHRAGGDVQRCLTKKPMQRNSAHGCARLCKVYGGGVTITAVENLKLRTFHHVYC